MVFSRKLNAGVLFLSVMGAFVAPNLIVGGCAYFLSVGRPIFNLDYAVSVLFLAFGWRWLGGGFLFVALVVDALGILAQIMPFSRLGDVLYLMRFSVFASSQHLILMLGAVMLLFFVGGWVFWSAQKIGRLPALAFFNMLAVASVLAQDAPNSDKKRFYRTTQYSWVESQSVVLARTRSGVFLSMFAKEGNPLVAWGGESASEPFWHEVDQPDGGGRMLLVVVESWGVPKDARIQEALLAPINKLNIEKSQSGQIEQAGMTLAGELRELCHLFPEHYNLSDVNEGFENCLPNRLRAKGFVTASMHGATSLMYDRNRWYPRAGFQQHIFFEDRIWPRRCYSFPGACDLDLFSSVESYFSQSGKRFFYWLTLNTHGPNDMRDLRHDLFDCERFGVASDSESCRNFKLHAQFFEGFAKLLSSPEMKGVEFVVVGDHAPTLLDVNEKSGNFQERVVPWFAGVVR